MAEKDEKSTDKVEGEPEPKEEKPSEELEHEAKTKEEAEEAKEAIRHAEDGEEVAAAAENAAIQAGSPKPMAWGTPLEKADKAWSKIESTLCRWVLLAEIVAMFVWISLKGLSAPAGSPAGPLYRSLITSVLLGLVAFLVVRKAVKGDGAGPQRTRAIVVTIAVVLGLVLGRAWAGKGIEYSSNLLNWVQNASALMLIGGLRGLVTRFTLWVALLGASLATSKGKHINIDVVMRAVPVKARAAVAIVGWTAASLMCFGAAAGFSDFIAVTKSQFGAPVEVDCPGEESKPQGQRQQCATTAGSKMAHVKREMGHDMFLLGRQISLDFKTLPKVLGGTKYDGWLGAQEWNAWLKDSEPDWVARFGKEEYERKLLPPDLATKQVPATPVLGERERAGLLIRTTNFIFPLGFIMLGLRFLLRVLLVLSGHIRVDPDAVHEDEDLKHAHDGEPQKGGA